MSILTDKREVEKVLPYIRKVYGPYWYKRVNPDRLAMMSPSRCVLGQLNEGDMALYMTGMKALDSAGLVDYSGSAFVSCDQAWKSLIRGLRGKVKTGGKKK